MTHGERSRCLRWRLVWLSLGYSMTCPIHPPHSLTEFHAIHFLDLHYYWMMSQGSHPLCLCIYSKDSYIGSFLHLLHDVLPIRLATPFYLPSQKGFLASICPGQFYWETFIMFKCTFLCWQIKIQKLLMRSNDKGNRCFPFILVYAKLFLDSLTLSLL